ncbi:SI1L3 protein, partial [Acrocephalus arundinaceus]|nr:SI1L3 protein [Acrocephalus arundinaceus]
MGVRARVAEWPPRSKDPKESPKNSQNSNFKPFRRPPAHSKDVEFRQGFLGISGMPLRQRSSSEVTLSECDPEESAEMRGNSLGNAGMFREYGSTSSIDVQGIPEQSFFEMLNEFRAKKPEFPGIKAETKAENREEIPQSKEKRRRCLRPDESLFKKLRNAKDPEELRLPKPWICRKAFAHFDVQSLFFEAVSPGAAGGAARRRNTTTGASAASAASDPAFSSTEDLNSKENLEKDLGDDTSNELLLSCPHFRNEIGGGRGERDVSFSKSSSPPPALGISGSSGFFLECGNFGKSANAGISVLEVPKEQQRDPERLRRFSLEHADLGARYYRDYFHGK